MVHVVDGSAPDPEGQMDAVRTVLDEIGAAAVPELVVVNKADRGARAPPAGRRIDGSVLPLGRAPARAWTSSCDASADRLRVADRVVELRSPGPGATCWPRCTARARWSSRTTASEAARVHVVLDDAGRARFAEFVAPA